MTADQFLETLERTYLSVQFTMEVKNERSLHFVGIELCKQAPTIETKVYLKPTNTGLPLHVQSHVDIRYKRGLINTLVVRAYRLSSDWSLFAEECDRRRKVFDKLKYPRHLIRHVVDSNVILKPCSRETLETVRVVLPLKDQTIWLIQALPRYLNSAGSRPRDKWGTRSSRPLEKGGGQVSQKNFRLFGPKLGLKIRWARPPPRAPPLDPPLLKDELVRVEKRTMFITCPGCPTRRLSDW